MTPRAVRWFVFLLLLSGLSAPAWGALSGADEVRLGKRVMTEVRPLGLTRNPALDAIGARLAPTTQRKDITWHFWVVEGMKEYNAFAAPGGFVFISRPYFEKLNTDEVAFVIGHEMAHVDLRHPERTMKRAQKATLGNLLLRVLTNSPVLGTAADLGATAYVTHYSRVMEREADFGGYGFAQQAGYNPDAAVTALSKLGKNKSLHPWISNIWGTHPLLSSREDQLAARGGKEPAAVGPPPPPSPQHKLNAGLQPFEPARAVAVRVLSPDGQRWEGAWRKSFSKILQDRLTPFGFTSAGDNLMSKRELDDPREAARSRKAKYLLLVTVKEMSSTKEEAPAPGSAAAKVDMAARFLDVDTGEEVWTTELTGTDSGLDLLPMDQEALYPDTILGGLVWRSAGDLAVGFARHLGATPEPPQPVEKKPSEEGRKP